LEIVIDTWYAYGDFLFFKSHPCDLDNWEKCWDPMSLSTANHSHNDPYGVTKYSRKFVYPTAVVTPRTSGNPGSQFLDDLRFKAAQAGRAEGTSFQVFSQVSSGTGAMARPFLTDTAAILI
jgi:hypothetical protein